VHDSFNTNTPPPNPIFSLALRRPSPSSPRAGGLLAIGGISNFPHDNRWTRVPIQPLVQGLYAWYQIGVDGFDITPPTRTRRRRPITKATSAPTKRRGGAKNIDPA